MARQQELEAQARELAAKLLDDLVASSEQVDYRMGTYLLSALGAELGELVQQRCWELARTETGQWELAAAESETWITAAWRCMATIAQLADT